jgi:phosphate transport system substrate-binding protein
VKRFAVVAAIALGFPAGVPADVARPSAADHRLEIRGADAMVPVMRRLAEVYMQAHPDAKVLVAGHYADRGTKALIVGVADMAMGVDDLQEDTRLLAELRGVKLVRTCVFRDAIVPVVAVDNPLRDISVDQLRGVFRGAITSWQALGGSDVPITVVTQEVTSGAYQTWKSQLLADDTVVSRDAVVAREDEYEDRITATAIGFLGMNWVGKLRAPSVNGVAATADTVRSGAYPIVRTSCVYQRDGGTPLGNAFLDYVFSPDGQRAIAAMQLVPIAREGSP